MTKSLQKLLTTLFVLCLLSANVFGVPQVTFTSPTAGQTYTVGVDASIPVTFEVTNAGSSNLALYLFTADMSVGQLLTTLVPSNGTNTYNYSLDTWQFPQNYKLMIKEENSPVELAYSQVFTIVNSNKIITLRKPESSSTCFSMQQSMQIEWRSNAISMVNILYSINNGVSWNTIANNIGSSDGYNTFTWQIPNFIESTEQCKIKVEENDGDPSIVSSLFRISQPESYGFSKPLGTETFTVGVNQDVPLEIYYTGCSELNPTTGGNVFSIMLEGSTSYNVGVFDQVIKENSSWTYTYTLPNTVIPGSYKFSYSSQGKIFQSPGTITINNNQKLIEISDTVENAYYTVSQVYPIWWSALNVGAVNIYYSIDNGSTWSTIATNVTSSNGHNTHLWNIPSSITSTYRECKIKITDVAAQAPDDISLKFTLSNLPKFTILSPLSSSTYTVGTDTEIPFTVSNNSVDNGTYMVYLNDAYVNSMSISPQTNSTFYYSIPAKMNSGSYRFKIQTGSEALYSEYFNVVNNSYSYKFLTPTAGNSYSSCNTTIPVKIEVKGVGPVTGTLFLDFVNFPGSIQLTQLNIGTDGIIEYNHLLPADLLDYSAYRYRYQSNEGEIYSEQFTVKTSSVQVATPNAGAVIKLSETPTIPVTVALTESCQPRSVTLYFVNSGANEWLANFELNSGTNSYTYNYSIPSVLNSGQYKFLASYWDMKTGTQIASYSGEFTINTNVFDGGDGTQMNPYQVSNAAQLNAVRNYLNAHFIQTANIDLGVAPWNDGEGWLPIGSASQQFTGRYNGNGYSISNLRISRSAVDNLGLFGYSNNATLERIALQQVNVEGKSFVGSLLGYSYNSNINSCTVSGNISGVENIGGIVGYGYNCTLIDNLSNISVVASQTNAGGILGGYGTEQNTTKIERCRSEGSVVGKDIVGGVAGYVGGNSSIVNIAQCFSNASVSGTNRVGGFIGYVAYTNISNCYSAGNVISTSSCGGFAGYLANSTLNNVYSTSSTAGTQCGGLVGAGQTSTVNNSFWNTDVSGITTSVYGTGLAASQMIVQNAFTSWDFSNIWQINEGITYPYLKWQGTFQNFNKPLLPPSNLSVIPANQAATITWSAPSVGTPDKYFIYRDAQKIAETTSNSYADNGLVNGTIYNYHVTAIFGTDESVASKVLKAYIFTGFAGGNGTEVNPYQVSNAEQLNAARYYLESQFIQTADIDLGVAPWNEGEGWLPIGTSTSKFLGKYNGQGFSITNMKINRPALAGVGLFGWASGATISNVKLDNVDIVGQQRIGALIGSMHNNGIISKCSSSGITQGGNFTAGLVGNLYYGSLLSESFSSCTVVANDGFQQAGGLVGRVLTGYVQNCYATGSVNCTNWAGGLIGNATNNSAIASCYSTGKVNGVGYCGGLVGGTIETTVTNCYWNTETSLQSVSAGGLGLNTAQMLSQSTFVDWDFTNVWSINESATYPYLKWQDTPATFNQPPTSLPPVNFVAIGQNGSVSLSWTASSLGVPAKYKIYRDGNYIGETSAMTYNDMGLVNNTEYRYCITAVYGSTESVPSNTLLVFVFPGFQGGAGTELNPYQVSSIEQLNAVRYYNTSYFVQTANINMGVAPWNEGEGWNPIGADPNENVSAIPFSGTYNGNGFTISNLTINKPTGSDAGLFGYAQNAKFSNVNLTNVNIIVGNTAGSLVGEAGNTTIINSISSGYVKTINAISGGIAGWVYGSTISKSSSTAIVEAGSSTAGGLIGYQNGSTTVSESWSSGNVSGTERVGGLVGESTQNDFIIDCYSSSKVTGSLKVGGLVGAAASTGIITVQRCYSVGEVTGTESVGGLIGIIINTSSILENSYWNTETSKQTVSAGGIGLGTLQMISQNFFNTWDFANVWSITEGVTYPYLKWQVNPNYFNIPASSLKPLNLVLGVNNQAVTLTWEKPLFGNPSKYVVYRNSEKIGESNTLSFTNSGLTNNTTYQYYVTAVFDDIERTPSNIVSVYVYDGIISGTDDNNISTTAPDWTRLQQYGGTGANIGQVITSDANFNYIVANIKGVLSFGGQMFTCVGDNDLLIAKYTKTGTPVWIKTLNAQAEGLLSADALNVDNAGNVYLAATINKGVVAIGSSTIACSNNVNSFFAKFDSNGNGLWASGFYNASVNSNLSPTRIVMDANADVYLLSKSSLLVKYSTNGAKQWEQTYPNRTLQAIFIKGNMLYLGGALQNGTTYFGGLHLNSGGGYNTGFIVKGDLNGNYTQSLAGFNTNGDGSVVSDIFVDDNNDLFVSGGYYSKFFMGSLAISTNTGKYHAYLAKFDSNMNSLWIKKSSSITDNTRSFIWSTRLYFDNSGNLYQFGSNTGSFTYESTSVNILTGNQFLVKFDLSGSINSSYSLVNTSKDKVYISSDGRLVTVKNVLGGNFTLSQYTGITTQDWAVSSTNTTYGTAIANFTKVDKYGNYFVLSTANGKCNYFGNSFNDNESYKLLAKHDITGNLIWVRKIKGLINGGSQGSNIALDKDNNIAITGQFISLLNAGSVSISQNNSYTHGVVLKYNSNGDIVSIVQIRNVSGGNIMQYTPIFDNDGNLIVSGTFSKIIQIGDANIYGNSVDDAYMAKFDVNGNYLWSKSFCGSDMEWMGLLSCDANNNIYMTGEFHSSPLQIGNISLSINKGDGSTVLAKFDPNGNALWAKTYGGVPGANPDSWPVNIRTDIHGNTFLWGWCPNNSAFGSFVLKNTLVNSYMYYLCKVNTNGDVLWAKAIEEKTTDFNYHDLMDIDNYGNVYVGGHLKDQYKVDGKLYNIRGVEDFFIAKYSNNGILQWMKSEPQMVFQNGTIQSLAVYRNNTLIVSGNHSGKLVFGDKTFKSTGQNAFIAVLGELPALPVAVTKPASVNSKKSGEVTVLLNGIANANNNDASVIFEYGTTTAYGSSIAGNPTKISGSSNVSINASFEGVDSEVYHYRLKVETPEGVVYGDDMTISAQLPAATTLAANGVDFSSAQVNGKVNAKGNSVGVGFEYGLSTAYGTTVTANPVSLSSNTDVNVSASLSDLSPNTTYHFRVFTIGDNPAYGEDLTFTTGSLTPIAIIQTASNITKVGATLNGLVNASGYNVTVEYEYGTTSAYGSTINASPFDVSGNSLQNIGAAISSLQAGTTYKYRIKVSGASSVVYSDEMTFTTLPEPPTVTTIAASNILATGALACGTVNPNGATTAVYIDYGTTSTYGTRVFANQTSISGSAVVNIDKMLSGLEKNTEYHFRVMAVNAGGTAYGDDMVFTTLLESKPTVVTGDALEITKTSATISGLVNSNKNETTVEFNYGEDNTCSQTAAATPASVSGTTEGNLSVNAVLTGLKSNTVYYYRLKGVNIIGESVGDVKSFRTLPSKPIAVTQLAKNIGKSSADLSGVANANGVLTNALFEYGLTTDYGAEVNATPSSISGNTNEPVVASIVGLASNTTYHFRLKASSADGVSYGEDFSFTTLPLDPAVSTLDATEIAATTAIFNGVVNANNSTSLIEFEWGTTPSFGANISANPVTISGSKTVSVMKEITDLVPNTQYYYRIKATNAGGVTYGEEKTFQTKALSPTLISSLATNISTTSATLKGLVKANSVNTQVTFEYGLSDSYGSSVSAMPSVISGIDETNVEALIDNLNPNTVYHFRVKAENSGGITYGDNQTFTTRALSPAVISAQVINITTNSSTFKGRVSANGVSTTVRFVYGTSPSCDNSVDATPSAVIGTVESDVEVAMTGLTPNTTYYYRLKAESSGGITYSNVQNFTTMPLAPAATMLSATDITSSSAILNGLVVANGVNTEVVFEYGVNTFDKAVNANPYVVSGSEETAVSIKLENLEQATTYQYRLKASSLGGVSFSATGSFTTIATNIEGNLANKLVVYPNPAEEFVYIFAGDNTVVLSIGIYDLAGTLIMQPTVSNKLNISSLARGVYLVKITTSEGVLVEKLIVEKRK